MGLRHGQAHEVPMLFRALKEGKIKYDTVVTATEADQAISENNLLSNSPIVAGVDYRYRN